MRVLHLASLPTLTGAAEPAWDLVRELRGLGVHVDLHVDRLRSGTFRDDLAKLEFPELTDLELSSKSSPVGIVRDISKLRRMLPNYDVVHTHLSHDHALSLLAGATASSVLVRTLHAPRAFAKGWIRSWAFRRTPLLTVACDAHKTALLKAHPGVSTDSVLVLAGSVSAERFHRDESARARTRKLLGIEPGKTVVVSVARFQAGRHHPQILDALPQLPASSLEDLRVLFLGKGETEPSIRKRVDEDPVLRSCVIFGGFHREALNDYLSASDAAIWLKDGNDATSRAVLQAMACELPVIGTCEGATAEAVIEGETGWLVNGDHPVAIAKAFERLLAAQSRRAEMGRQARKRAFNHYDPRRRAESMLAAYDGCLRLRSSGQNTAENAISG
jgi:glycosyltransferase involved in cell wall biosynthesis